MNRSHPSEDQLIARALGDLDPDAATDLDAHLTDCESCSGAVSRLVAALGAYRAEEPPEAPAWVLAELLAAQRVPPGTTPPLRRPFGGPGRLLAAAAAVVVLFASGFWTGRASERSMPAGVNLEVGAPASRTLPEPPAIEFRSEPPMEIWFATVRGGDSSASALGGAADSL